MNIVAVFLILGLFEPTAGLTDKEKWDAFIDKHPLPKDDTGARPRIVNGTITRADRHPWLVSLHYKGTFKCGGSIYNNRTIITAAHCVIGDVEQKYGRFTVKVGDHMLRWKDNTEAIFRVDNIIANSKYRSGRFGYDVAVLTLNEELTLDESVRALPVTIPQRWKERQLIKRNNCYVYGWGINELSELDNVVNEARAFIQNYDFCAAYIGESGIAFNRSQHCATYFNQTVCQGDSGGPLICYDKNDVAYHVALCEYGPLKCDREFSGYTRMVSFRKWIQNNVH